MTSEAAAAKNWLPGLRAYTHPRVRSMLFLGFSAGLAFPMVLTTLSLRLREAGINRSTIGWFSLVGLAYSLKFFWAPIVDRLHLPLLGSFGRRRSWMLLAQAGIAAGLVSMALCDPATEPAHMALLAVLTAFAAATQDIAIDAWRIEAVGVELQGSMAAAYSIGYQIALICGGAGALTAASALGWTLSYLLMAGCVGVGVITTLLIAEPQGLIDRATLAQEQRVVDFLERSAHWPAALRSAAAWLIGAVVCPFVDFFARKGLRAGLLILALIMTYRLNYFTMGVASLTFYHDLGFTLNQIALVSKGYGLGMTLLGGIVGGALVARYGMFQSLLAGWTLLTAANLFYAFIAEIHPGMWWFAAAVSLDNFANGIAGVSFIAYMSSLTSVAYTATQYALFGTLWALPDKSLASPWGVIVDAFGYRPYFIYTALIGLPALFIMWRMSKRQ